MRGGGSGGFSREVELVSPVKKEFVDSSAALLETEGVSRGRCLMGVRDPADDDGKL